MIARRIGTVTRRGGARRWWPSFLLATLACTSQARFGSVYDGGSPPRSACLHRVQLLSTTQLARPYRELARLSATCPQLTPLVCEQALLDRGCALGADAVVIDATATLPRTAGTFPTPRGPGNQARLAQDARAVCYESPLQMR